MPKHQFLGKASLRRRIGLAAALLVVVAVLLMPVLFSSCFSSVPTPPPGSTPAPLYQIVCSKHTSQPVSLTMYYGTEKQKWIDDVVKDFNQRKMTACDGPIKITPLALGSGESMQKILSNRIQPDIWSPAGSAWLALLNDQWRAVHGSDFVGTGATAAPVLFTSPVVIAMWQPQAKALGWPGRSLGWADIARLSTTPNAWAAYGHGSDWGDFKFGHTHPGESNSGLDAVIAENYAAVRKTDGLTSDDVTNSKDFVANVESSIIHYGESTGLFADEMFTRGPAYLSAAVLYENLVVEANDGKTYPHLPYPVVAIYPKEGTFLSDHPFVIPQANWITPAKKAAAEVFGNFLLDRPQQEKALQYGFRPADPRVVAIGAPIDAAHGVDPKEPKTTLQVPTLGLIKKIQSSWNEQRRKVDVMLILDRSGSMNNPTTPGGRKKIDAAKAGLVDFVAELGNSDDLGLTVFSDAAQVLTPVSPLGQKRQQVLDLIARITAEGSTRLYDTIDERVRAFGPPQQGGHNQAVVLLTDGMENASHLNLPGLLKDITPTGANAGEGIKVYTIAYGDDADQAVLTSIAEATGGKEYYSTPDTIMAVYLEISQFFGGTTPSPQGSLAESEPSLWWGTTSLTRRKVKKILD